MKKRIDQLREKAFRHAFITVMILFIISVFFRGPFLNRPLSKHHELNTAVVLIGIESWQQAGGASASHFIPLMNFQHAGDKLKPNQTDVDSKGNLVYLSFGPGWYVIPYYLFQWFHLTATPLSLQIFSLLLELVALALLFYLCVRIEPFIQGGLAFPVMTTTFFMFSACILWYFGNGYVLLVLAIVPVLVLLHLYTTYLEKKGTISLARYLLMGSVLALLAYIDWYGFFLAATLLFFTWRRKEIASHSKWKLVVVFFLGLSLTLGLIFYQYISHLGWEMVQNNLQARFAKRSITTRSVTTSWWMHFPKHFLTSFGLIFLLLPWLAWHHKKIKQHLPLNMRQITYACLLSALLYNLVFLSWSIEHEFSILHFAIPFSLLMAWYLLELKGPTRLMIILAFILSNLTVFFLVNRPGEISYNGDRYDHYQTLGEQIKKIQKPHYALYMNHEFSPQIMYYAGRSVYQADSLSEAYWIHNDSWVDTALYIQQKGDSIRSVKLFTRGDIPEKLKK